MSLASVSPLSVPKSRKASSAPLVRHLSHSSGGDTFERARPALRRVQSAPAPIAPAYVAGMLLVESLQLVRRTAGDLVALVQAERASAKITLLSELQTAALRDAVMRQLHRTGLTLRLGERLEDRMPSDELHAVTRFFHGPWGAFYRDTVNPLAQDLERVVRSYREEHRACEPKPDPGHDTYTLAPRGSDVGETRRAQLQKVLPLVHALVPQVKDDPTLCDMLAGVILLRLDRHGVRQLRRYQAAFEAGDFAPLLDRLGAWVQQMCVKEGIVGWALGRADALMDLEACNRTLSQQPSAVPPLRRRAEIYLERLHEPLRALKDWRRLVQVDPSAEHWVGRAKAYIAMERWPEAEADLAEAMRLAPDAAAPHGWRAVILLHRGEVERARRALRRGERRDPYEPDVCLAKLKLDEYALTERLKAEPDSLEAFLERAVCRGGQRNYAGALRDCRSALELAPENPQAAAGCDLYASILGVEPHGD